MESTDDQSVVFEVDHLRTTTCDISAVSPETLLTRFIRESAGTSIAQSMICDIVVDTEYIYVMEKTTNAEMERWPLVSVKSCKPLPIQPAVFPNRYNNVLSVTTPGEIHLFNLLDMDAAKAADVINEKMSPDKKLDPSAGSNKDSEIVDFSLETLTLNRCFDDIEAVINRIQRFSVEFQNFNTRWSEYAANVKKGKVPKQKDADKRRAADWSAVTAKRVRSEELMDILQKIKLALIIVGRLRSFLRPPSATAKQYVSLLFSPLTAIVGTTNEPPLSATPFDFVKSIDAPLFRKDILSFILASIPSNQVEFWKNLGEPWNIPLEDWQYDVRPYRPVFPPDNYSPYLPFLDPAVISVFHADGTDVSNDENGEVQENVIYGVANELQSRPSEADGVVGEVEAVTSPSIASEFKAPLEIEELDKFLEAADVSLQRPRATTDSQSDSRSNASNRRVLRAKVAYQASDPTELSVEEDQIVEIIDVAGSVFVVRNIFGESGRVPGKVFEEVTSHSDNRRVLRARRSYQAANPTELSVEEDQIVEIIDVSGSNFVVRNIFGEIGQVPVTIFEEIPKKSDDSATFDDQKKSTSSTSEEAESVSNLSADNGSTRSASIASSGSRSVRSEVTKNVIYSRKSRSSTSEGSVFQTKPDEVSGSSTPVGSSRKVAGRESRSRSASDTEDKAVTNPQVAPGPAEGPTFEEQVFSSIATQQQPSLTLRSYDVEIIERKPTNDRPTREIRPLPATSSESSDSDVGGSELVLMKPKKIGRGKFVLPEKDYKNPPYWMKKSKQNAFAASIRAAHGRVACANRDRPAQRFEELSIYKDEILELLETPEGSWWRARNAVDRVGFIPLGCVQEMEFYDDQETTKPERPKEFRPINPANLVVTAKVPIKPQVAPIVTSPKPPPEPPKPVAPPPQQNRTPQWANSQPELVIVEQESDTYRDYLLSRRRVSHDAAGQKAPFGAPLLPPFTSRKENKAHFVGVSRQKSANPQFEATRQKAASVLSLMITSQINRLSSGHVDMVRSPVSSPRSPVSSPLSPITPTEATAVAMASSDVTVQVEESSVEPAPSVASPTSVDSAPAVGKGVIVTSEQHTGMYVKRNQTAVPSRTNDFEHIRENMARVKNELNSLAASGQLRISNKSFDLKSKPKKDRQHRLQMDSSPNDVRQYLRQCGFSAQLVDEFGTLTGEQLLAKKSISDFERESLQPIETKRLFNLVQGARVLAGMNADKNARDEFEHKVIQRRLSGNENNSAAE